MIDPGLNIQQKVTACSERLAVWGREVTGNFSGRIRKCKENLKRFRGGRDVQSIAQYKEAKQRLSHIYNQREVFWRQRSKQLWLQAGDSNSKYFHQAASKRRRNNQIEKLKNEEGQWVQWDNGLPELISRYFSELFNASESDWQEIIDCVPRTVTAEQNEELVKQVEEIEVKTALFHMHPDKAPGPDGMTPAFFQKHWKIVGKDIVDMVRTFFETGEFC